MKRNHFIRLLFLLLLVGCTEKPLEFQGSPDFTVSHAKAFFEKNATALRGVRFGEKEMSRSTDYSNITPDWGSAEITQTGKITTVEIPLNGGACKIARTSRMTNSKTLYGFTTRVTTKLVVQKHVEAETPRHFVVTMIDGLSQNLKKNEKSNCYGTSDFSGYVIVSSVTGEYLESFQSTNGCWTRVYMAPGTKEDLEDSRNVGIHMLGSDASPAAYNLGEDGTSICSNCGNMLSMCTCCKLCGGKGCSECTVIVYPTCPKCRYTGPGAASGFCWCCSVCHNYPCTCYTAPDPDPVWPCPKCGSRYCNGSCQTGGGSGPTNPEKPDECHHKQCPVCNKMIRTLTRASSCDSHDYCENDGQCVRVQVNVSKNVITLGDTYTITLNLTPQNIDCFDITYYMIKDGQEFVLSKPNRTPKTLVNMARTPGNFQIKAVVMQNGTLKEYSGTTSVTQVFPHRDEILQQQLVLDHINDAWNQTLASANSSTIQEYGGVVTINTKENNTGSLYRFEPYEGKPAPYSAPIVTVDMSSTESNYGPHQGGEFAVLLFHTHPPYWEYKRDTLYERKTGPSDPDIESHTTIPAVVKDFQHPTGWINSLMSKSEYVDTEKLYFYGIDRRIN